MRPVSDWTRGCLAVGALTALAAVSGGAGCGARSALVDDVEGCGDGYCTWDESAATCPEDCPQLCGDGICSGVETIATCPEDCADVACGDSVCEGGENAATCPSDCRARCGDGACTHDETSWSCPEDCGGLCGDGVCSSGESAYTCPEDCAAGCGDGLCDWTESARTCPTDCPAVCGDGACTHDEDPMTCPWDCGEPCGDGVCDWGESAWSCPDDCPPVCGDGACTHDEDAYSCPEDCGVPCGDGACSAGESAWSCPEDCPPVCGDGSCTHDEDYASCPDDCASGVGVTWEARSFIDLELDPSAVAARATELSSTGSDDGYLDVPIGFDFPFFGETFVEARVSTNGYITFGFDGTDFTNDRIPDVSQPNAYIAPFWDNLAMRYEPDADRASRILYATRGTAPNRHLVVEWSDFLFDEGNNSLTFEAILHENGSIQTLYHDMTGWSGAARPRGSSATIGIESPDGRQGFQYAYESADAVRPGAVVTYRPTGDAYDISRTDDLVSVFRDIRYEGTSIPLGCDDCVGPALPIGFSFGFYGRTYTTFTPTSNGWVAFDATSGSTSPGNGPLPGTLPGPGVACLWDDLDGRAAGAEAHYALVGGRSRHVLIVQYTNWGFFGGGDGRVTYQVRLDEASGVVDCLYGPLEGGGDQPIGGSATVGIQDETGARGLEVFYEDPTLEPGDRVAFLPVDDGHTDYVAFGLDDNWVDLRSSGAATGLMGDDDAVDLAIGFDVRFFGERLREVTATTNGQINLEGSAAYSNTALPDPSAPSGLIAALWDDLAVDEGAAVLRALVGAPGDRVFVVQWSRVSFLGMADSDLTFQLRLYEADGAIEVAYGGMLAPTYDVERLSGGQATVGLQDRMRRVGILAGWDDAGISPSGGWHRFVQR